MTNLSKTFDDSFKKEVIDLIKQGLKKELPAGAVYSASKKPPEGAREFTTDRGTKYWVPGKKDKEDKPKSRVDFRNINSTPVAGATYTGSAVTQKVPMKNVGAWLDAIERGETDEEMQERVIGELKSDSPGKVGIPDNLSDKDYSKVISNIQPDNIIRFRMLELKQNVTEGVVRSAKPQEHKRWIQEYGEDKIGDGKGGLKTPLIVQAGGLYRQDLIERGYPTEIPIDAIGRRGKRGQENGIFQVVTPKQAKPKA